MGLRTLEINDEVRANRKNVSERDSKWRLTIATEQRKKENTNDVIEGMNKVENTVSDDIERIGCAEEAEG